ncbi:MAG: hypothetical protein CMH30_03790 [Micavibrio sp.]|nr:hypothetical protein [Micavibrio sp.]|tara:strand:+ start:258 stop:1475 length:1218 start_codon:yes stop_codon:yes gene_type:complete
MVSFKGTSAAAFLLASAGCTTVNAHYLNSTIDSDAYQAKIVPYKYEQAEYLFSDKTRMMIERLSPDLLPVLSEITSGKSAAILTYSEAKPVRENGDLPQISDDMWEGIGNGVNAVVANNRSMQPPPELFFLSIFFSDYFRKSTVILPDLSDVDMCDFFENRNAIDMQFFECDVSYEAFYAFVLLHEAGHVKKTFMHTLTGEVYADRIAHEYADRITLSNGKKLSDYIDTIDVFFRQFSTVSLDGSHAVAPFNSGVSSYGSFLELDFSSAGYTQGYRALFEFITERERWLDADDILKGRREIHKKHIYEDRVKSSKSEGMMRFLERYAMTKIYLSEPMKIGETMDQSYVTKIAYMQSFCQAVEKTLDPEILAYTQDFIVPEVERVMERQSPDYPIQVTVWSGLTLQ